MRKKLQVLLIALIILLQAFTPAVFAASKNEVQSQTAYLCPFDPTSEGAGNAAKADFYVAPSGEAIPSTGYRYMSENASYLAELYKTKNIPANLNGTYFSFNKYDVASPGKLQVPHDASIRGSFDTLQIIDDIRIPNGNWGKANYPEPITKDFPEFGTGGATQAVTNSQIILNEITKLPK